jgi:hypothetical protein
VGEVGQGWGQNPRPSVTRKLSIVIYLAFCIQQEKNSDKT